MLYALYHQGNFVRIQDFSEPPPFLASEKEMEWLPYTPPPPPGSLPPTPEQIMQTIVANTQERLDNFARSRNYDGILSACTYASSPTPKFATEGQYCINKRDETWAKLYAIMNEVQNGTRPMPSDFSEIVDDLPELIWPT